MVRTLSFDHTGLIPLIHGLATNGATAMGDAINMAQDELNGPRHRDGNLKVILLISDGSSNRGADPLEAAHNAKSGGTLIYALGIGNPVEDDILRQVVSDPDSMNYWSYPDSSKYDEIIERMHGLPSYLAARDITITELIDPRFDYVSGSFSLAPDSMLGDVVRWSTDELGTGETWEATFRVTASDTGFLPVEQIPASNAYYKNFAGAWVQTPFPQGYVNVVMGVGVEERLHPGGSEEGVFSLGPNPFHQDVTVTYFGDGLSNVRLTVHDLAGRLVKTLVDEVPAAGNHVAHWQGENNHGVAVAAGAYVCRYESAETVHSEILLYLK
jgi:hypothetical protein